MSDTPQDPGWWQASDGKWYPPESRPPSLDKPPSAPPGIRPPLAPQPPRPGEGPPSGYGPPPGYGPPAGTGPTPGYGAAPGFGPGGYGTPYAPRRQTEPLAIASLIVACAAIPLGCFCFIGWFGSPVALLLGYLGKKKIGESGGQLDGDGLALAGMIVGGVGTALLVLGVVWIAFLGGSSLLYSGSG